MENYRQIIEQREAETLSPYAQLSSNTRGRVRPLEPCPVRTDFVRDRDRIIHCKSFRRLKHKTQVFLSPVGDHYRTRLTHTLEVSQIARTIARGLLLNEDLTEAIAMGHDLGHTPFGHSGENVLNRLVPGGFEHNEQSLRVVEKLENGVGLNLTYEVRDGILNHKKSGRPCTLEGVVVSLADRIAYINHDIDDAIRANLLKNDELPESCIRVIGATHGERINTLICDVLKNSFGKNEVRMSDEVYAEFNKLRTFLFDNLYYNPIAKAEERKAESVIESLYRHYLAHVDDLPDEFTKYIDEDGAERVAADYIACMTDRYAVRDYKRLFVPEDWI
ncbi:MAG: deoxyguanosinetriphosphate triphosphohydrolase [Christensenellaceae bacterium]|nr:deoxyguanosinetriphosphate triphosphohydrolase [Christensenellaceae bacterium]